MAFGHAPVDSHLHPHDLVHHPAQHQIQGIAPDPHSLSPAACGASAVARQAKWRLGLGALGDHERRGLLRLMSVRSLCDRKHLHEMAAVRTMFLFNRPHEGPQRSSRHD